MYPSSSTAYASRRAPDSSRTMASSGRHDERLSSGPLTGERAKMEQIRSMLEKTQRRMARQHATSTSQHGYNSSSGRPMSIGVVASSSSQYHSHSHSRHPPSSRHPSSRSHHHHHQQPASNASEMRLGSSQHYFPPNYTSGRAPRVQSVYLEDLPMTFSSSSSTAPYSRGGPTSYAPGGGMAVPPLSRAPSYYAPSLDETTRSRRATHHIHHSYEGAPAQPPVHVRSERHAVHRLQHQHQQHHHHHHQAEPPSRSSATAHRHHHQQQHQHQHHDGGKRPHEQAQPPSGRPQPPQGGPPSVNAPPPSTRGILRKTSTLPPPSATMPQYGDDAPLSENYDSSNFMLYAPSHGSVPMSTQSRRGSAPQAPPSSSSTHRQSRQPLAANGQPERSALKRTESFTVESETDEAADDVAAASSAAVEAPPPSSRVRWRDELAAASLVYQPLVEVDEEGDDTDDNEELEFLGEELPYNPEDDLLTYEHDTDDDDEDYDSREFEFDGSTIVEEDEEDEEEDEEELEPLEPLEPAEPVVARATEEPVARTLAEEIPPPPLAVAVPAVAPASPDAKKKTRSSSEKDKESEALGRPVHRHRGSLAARTPPNLSPVGTGGQTRKSLPEPPKSAIDASLFANFDLRERRGSKEKRVVNASPDVNTFSQEKVFRRSSVSDAYSTSVMAGGTAVSEPASPSSSIDMHFPEHDLDSPRDSRGSLHESDLAFDDDEVPSVPSDPYRNSLIDSSDEDKTSPSSSDDYLDARNAFSEDDDSTPANSEDDVKRQKERPTATAGGGGGGTKTADKPAPPKSTYDNLWKSEKKSAPQPERLPAQRPVPAAEPANKAQVPPATPITTEISPPSSPDMAPARPASSVAAGNVFNHHHHEPSQHHATRDHHRLLAEAHAQLHSKRPPNKPMPLSQSLMMMMPPTSTRSSHRPPPLSTHIRPSPATTRPSVTRTNSNNLGVSRSLSSSGVARAPMTVDGCSAYIPRRLRPKSNAPQLRKVMPPSIGALSGLASGPVTFELNVESFYEVEWTTGEFGFSFQRVYLEDVGDDGAPGSRRMFLRMLLNTERGTCPSFKQIHVGDVLIEVGGTRICDIKLDQHGGGSALTKFFTELRTKTPLSLVFQRMDPMDWEGGVEL